MPDVKFIITIDSSGSVKAIETLDQALVKLRGETETTATTAAGASSKFGGLWKQFAIGQMAVHALHKAYAAFKGFIVESVNGAMEAEAAQTALATALDLTGKAAQISQASLLDFSKAQMMGTIYTDEQIQGVETLLIQLTKLDEVGIKRATRGVIGLAAVMGTDLDSAARTVQKAMEGNYTALQRVGIKVDENLVGAEKQNALLDKLEGLYGRATAQAGTFQGRLAQLKNMWGEVGEELGKAIVGNEKVRDLIESVKTRIVELIESGKLKEWADTAAEGINALVNSFEKFMSMSSALARGGLLSSWLADEVSGINEEMARAQSEARKKIAEFASTLTDIKPTFQDMAFMMEQGAEAWRIYTIRTTQADDASRKLRDAIPKIPPEAVAGIYTLTQAYKDFGIKGTAVLTVEIQNAWKALNDAIAAGESPGVIEAFRKKFDELAVAIRGTAGEAAEKITLLNTAITAIPWGSHLPVLAAVEAWLRSTTTLTEGQLPVLAGYSGAVDTAARNVSIFRAELERLAGVSSFGLTLRDDLDKDLKKKKDQLLEFGKAMPYEEVKKLKEEIAELERKLAAGTKWDKFADGAAKAMAKIKAVTEAAFSSIDAIFAQSQKNKEIALDNEYKKRLANINATVTNEAKKGEMIIALDAEYDIKRRSLQHAAAKQQKAFSLAQAMINTAEGMTKALAQGGIFGPILAAVVAAFGAVQIALISKQPIPLARGAVFTKPTLLSAQTYEVAEAGEPEIVSPKSTIRDAVREAIGQLMPQGAFAGAGGSYTINFKGPLIVTNAALSEAEVNRASGYLFRAVDREAHRRGGRLLA